MPAAKDVSFGTATFVSAIVFLSAPIYPLDTSIEPGHIVIVTKDNTNLSLGGESVVTLDAGTPLTVTSRKDGWIGGYVMVDNITKKSGWLPDTAVSRSLIVTKDQTKLMKGKHTVAALAKGTPFVVTRVTDDWFGGYVEIDDKRHVGWVRRLDVHPPGAASRWRTTESLLLTAADAKKAKDGKVWISRNGKRVAYILQQGTKERLVVDGAAGPMYDEVIPCSFKKVFFSADEHFAYIARQGKTQRVVVDGREDEPHFLIGGYKVVLDPEAFVWSYIGVNLDSPDYVVVNGKKVHKLPDLQKADEVLHCGGHFMYVQYVGPGYRVVSDGKPEGPFGFVDDDTLLLFPTGIHAYWACDQIGKGSDYLVINGRRTAKYDAWTNWFCLSGDGEHYGFAASRGKDQVVAIVDGREYAVPGYISDMVLSSDGSHWACKTFKDLHNKVWHAILDGKVIAGPFEDIGGGVIHPISNDCLFAYVAQIGKERFVVVNNVEHARYSDVSSHSLTFSPDGKRLAYMAEDETKRKQFVVVDGSERKRYYRVVERSVKFGPDGRHLSYVASMGKSGEQEFVVIDEEERDGWDEILAGDIPQNNDMWLGAGVLGYVALRDGAYYWVEERASE